MPLSLILAALFALPVHSPEGIYADPSNGSTLHITALPRSRACAVVRRWDDGRTLHSTLQHVGGPVWVEWRPEGYDFSPGVDGESVIGEPKRASRQVAWDVSSGGVTAGE